MSNVEQYINSIIAKQFTEEDINRSGGIIEEPGFYWADSQENANYSQWAGPFPTHSQALQAGREFRREFVTNNLQVNQRLNFQHN